jgi:hypothetical protein
MSSPLLLFVYLFLIGGLKEEESTPDRLQRSGSEV